MYEEKEGEQRRDRWREGESEGNGEGDEEWEELREEEGESKRERENNTYLHSMTEETLKSNVCDKRFNVPRPHNRTLDTHTLPCSRTEDRTPTQPFKY